MTLNKLKHSSHHLGTLYSTNIKVLINSDGCYQAIETILKKYNVVNLGSVKHDFEGGGFTIVIALAESHISLHTWPEYGSVQLDVFLCNYINDNRVKSQQIFDDICEYFKPNKKICETVQRR